MMTELSAMRMKFLIPSWSFFQSNLIDSPVSSRYSLKGRRCYEERSGGHIWTGVSDTKQSQKKMTSSTIYFLNGKIRKRGRRSGHRLLRNKSNGKTVTSLYHTLTGVTGFPIWLKSTQLGHQCIFADFFRSFCTFVACNLFLSSFAKRYRNWFMRTH